MRSISGQEDGDATKMKSQLMQGATPAWESPPIGHNGGPQIDGMDPDLLKGATAIGLWIGRTRKAVYHMADTGQLPVFRLGGILYCRKSALRAYAEKLERQATDAGE